MTGSISRLELFLDLEMLVFVYGTLKRGFHNHHALASGGAEFVRCGVTLEPYPLVADEYFIPYLLDRPAEGLKVRGEVYQVDDECFARLDRLENYPAYYDRRELLIGGGGPGEQEARCWVYVKKEASAEQLAMEPMAEYALDAHKEKYVPRERRDASHVSKRTGPQLDDG